MLAGLILGGAVLPAQAGASDPASDQGGTSITADLDGDGSADRAWLTLDPQNATAELVIETAQGTFRGQAPVFSGPMDGQGATLALAEKAGLRILSGNISHGRHRWDQAITIAWHEGAFRVATITRSWWDTLSADSDGMCTVDFLTGRGVAEGPAGTRVIRIDAPAPALSLWDGVLPEECLG